MANSRRDDVLRVLVAAKLGTASRLRRLRGGNFGEVWWAETTGAGPVVVRFCPERQGVSSAAREALVLRSLRCPELPSPEVLWIDDNKETLVVTAIEGATVCAVTDGTAVVASAATVAARVHGCTPAAELPDTWVPLGPNVNDWAGNNSNAAALHEEALRLQDSRTAEAQVLVHGDFWTGNLLWDGSQAVGVVDWELAGLGCRGQDVAKMRLDLAMLLGLEAADEFRRAYTALVSAPVPNATYWDMRIAIDGYPDPGRWWLPTYRRLGYAHLSPEIVRARFRRYVERLVQ